MAPAAGKVPVQFIAPVITRMLNFRPWKRYQECSYQLNRTKKRHPMFFFNCPKKTIDKI